MILSFVLFNYRVLRPGDPGYVYRARVPQPSNRDYVIRPKWNVDEKPSKVCIRGFDFNIVKSGLAVACIILYNTT